MNRRVSRWSCLAIVALVNLMFWMAVAVAVGLIVSDAVDLGVETFVRERQATAAAFWEQVSSRTSEVTAKPTQAASPPPVEEEPEKAQPTPAIIWPDTPTPSQTPHARATPSTVSTGPTPTPSLQEPGPQPTATSGSSSSSPPEGPTPPAGSTPQATEALVSSPLLLADPDINSLMQLDAEMSRSATGRAVQIRYQEAALNQELESLLAAYPDLPYRNLNVELKRDRILLSGDVTVIGFDVSTEVVGTVEAYECLPQVDVQAIKIAGVITPGLVKNGIRDLILESLSWYPANYPLCLEQIVLEDGRMTVYGSRR